MNIFQKIILGLGTLIFIVLVAVYPAQTKTPGYLSQALQQTLAVAAGTTAAYLIVGAKKEAEE